MNLSMGIYSLLQYLVIELEVRQLILLHSISMMLMLCMSIML